MYLVFECRRVIFEWEEFDFKYFRNDTSLTIYMHIERDRLA